MWLNRFSKFLLHKRLPALILVFAISFVPIINSLSLMIVVLVTLVKGVLDGAFFLLATLIPALIIFWFRFHGGTLPTMLLISAVIAMVSMIATWIFAIMLREQKNWKNILQLSALAGVLIVSVVHLAYPHIADWWAVQLSTINEQFSLNLPAKSTTKTQLLTQQTEFINATKAYATGMVMVVLLLKAWSMLMMGRWWQGSISGVPILRSELYELRLNGLAGIFFIVAVIFWNLGNPVVLDIMPILYLLFGMAGLCLVHYLFNMSRTSMTIFWMSLFYIMIILSLPTSAMVISLIALLDSLFNIRNRIKKV